MKSVIDRRLISLKPQVAQQIFVRGGINCDKVEISFRYNKLRRPLQITVRFADADGRRLDIPVYLSEDGFTKVIPEVGDFFPSNNFGFIEFISPIDFHMEVWVEEDDSSFF
jgi:hypothetical protein